jgi:nanoRNase/pAp phosphatase (c-di-AMP/oligoRNAs hydrolase)
LRDKSLEEVMKDPEVTSRSQKVLDYQGKLREILLKNTTLKRNVIYVDLRQVHDMPDGNRFLLFTLFPQGNISVKVSYDTQRENTTAISVGYNIFNKTSSVNVGELLQRYGGGGHRVVGSCRVPNEKAEQAIKEIVAAVTE